jgi:hypothetical protein
MADETEDLPPAMPFDEIANKREREKKRAELLKLQPHQRGIDDVIEYLQDLYFPKSNGIDIARPATLAPYVDYYFLQAQEQIQNRHAATMESSIRYLCYRNGWDIFSKRYKNEIQHCEALYREKSSSADVEVYAMIRSHAKITQGTIGGRPETGFTPADKELIQKLAKVLGIKDTNLLIVFFWIAAAGSDGIGQHLIEHGKQIEASFDLQLKQRVHNMGFNR